MLLVIGMVSLVGQLGRIKPGMYIGPKEPNKKWKEKVSGLCERTNESGVKVNDRGACNCKVRFSYRLWFTRG